MVVLTENSLAKQHHRDGSIVEARVLLGFRVRFPRVSLRVSALSPKRRRCRKVEAALLLGVPWVLLGADGSATQRGKRPVCCV